MPIRREDDQGNGQRSAMQRDAIDEGLPDDGAEMPDIEIEIIDDDGERIDGATD